MPTTLAPSSLHPRLSWIASGACVLLGVVVFALVGKSDDPILACIAVLETWLRVGWAPALYLLAAWGMGHALTRWWFAFAPASHSLWLTVGLAPMLALTHMLTWLGGLTLAMGLLAWLPIVVGIALALLALRRPQELPLPAALESRWNYAGCIAMGCLLAAACSPPGVLWRSEFGGYDALSYHLPLPQEWLLGGGIGPSTHNVYGFLPSYLEAAFTHVGALRLPAMHEHQETWAAGLLDAHGAGILAAQQLHALLAIAACFACGRLARVAAACGTADTSRIARASALSFSLAACTPWTIVVGSLAYNEMPTLLGLAAIGVVLLHAAQQAAHSRALRLSLLVSLLAGMSVCVKPTAMLIVAVPAGLAMLVLLPKRSWMPSLFGASLAGALMLAPWMTRNTLATANPVFPFAASIFPNAEGGTGHWSKEQVARFTAGHTFDGTITDRLRLMVAVDARDPMGPTHRGLRHPQWGGLLLASFAVAAALALAARRHDPQRAASALVQKLSLLLPALLGVQLLLWLFATHIQSRFLLPMLPIAAATCGVGLAMLHAGTITRLITILGLGVQAAFVVLTLHNEPRGAAFGLLATPADLMGAPGTIAPNVPDDQLSPEQWINTNVPTDEPLLLLGDATPLLYRGKVVYATTWDTHPLARAISSSPNDPAGWAATLRAEGITRVLINASELARLERSGFLDPRLAPTRVADWAREQTTLIRAWPQRGQFLVELRPPSQ